MDPLIGKRKNEQGPVPSIVEGQALVEVLIGISLVALAVSLGAMLVIGGQQMVGDRLNAVEARALAKEGISAAKLILQDNEEWENLEDGEYGLSFNDNIWSFSGSGDMHGDLTRRVLISTLDDWRKAVRSEVFWDGPSSEAISVETATIVSRWENVLDDGGGPGSGDSGLSGDWTNPQTLSSHSVNPSGRRGRDVKVSGDHLYLGTFHSSIENNDFTVFDVSNPESPFITDEMMLGRGATALAATTSRVFAAIEDGTEGQLAVIDVSNPSSIATTTAFSMDGDEDAISIFLSENYLYLGREAGTDINEFNVFDVSNPDDPQLIGGLNVGGDVNKIFILDNWAYLATSLSNKELMIVDISDKSNLVELGSFNTDSSGMSIFATRRTRVFFGTNNTFHALNTSDPENISSFGTRNVGSSINDITVVGNLAFLATSHANQVLQIINIGDPSNMEVVSTFNFPQDATGIDYANNLVFVSVRSNDSLRIITSGE